MKPQAAAAQQKNAPAPPREVPASWKKDKELASAPEVEDRWAKMPCTD